MNIKMTFTIPEDVAHRLRHEVAQSKRSAFVTSAVNEKLSVIKKKEMTAKLVEDYIERHDEDRLISQEWDSATLEGWP